MSTDLKGHIASFRKWLDTGDGTKWQEKRRERLAWYRLHVTRDNIAKISRDDFSTLIKELWAVNIWHNKDYRVDSLIQENGLGKIAAALQELLFGESPLQSRWDAFKTTIKGLGPSSLSEILTFSDPQQYALVNLRPYQVLPRLGFSIEAARDGKSYKKAVDELGKLKTLLTENGIGDADFLLTDFFIEYLFDEIFDLQRKHKAPIIAPPPRAPETPVSEVKADDLEIATHESAEAVLLMLGNLLGYDMYTPDASRTYNGQKLGDIATLDDLPSFTNEKIIDSVRNIDVVWLKDEWPECFFEVEHTTGVTSGLLRIYQAQKLNTKFFIVGPEDVLKKFEREIQKSPFSMIGEKYRFRSYGELRSMYLAASHFRKASDHFLGVAP